MPTIDNLWIYQDNAEKFIYFYRDREFNLYANTTWTQIDSEARHIRSFYFDPNRSKLIALNLFSEDFGPNTMIYQEDSFGNLYEITSRVYGYQVEGYEILPVISLSNIYPLKPVSPNTINSIDKLIDDHTFKENLDDPQYQRILSINSPQMNLQFKEQYRLFLSQLYS